MTGKMAAALTAVVTCTAFGQQQVRPARGEFVYRVDGMFEGEPMEPWEARATVADSANAIFLKVVVLHGPGEFRYSYTPTFASWHNQGRMSTSECSTQLRDKDVPDFALPYYLAANTSRGAHVTLTLLQCREGVIERMPIEGDVVSKDGVTVKGGSSYPFEVIISNDGRIVRFVQPQGSVGQAMYTLR